MLILPATIIQPQMSDTYEFTEIEFDDPTFLRLMSDGIEVTSARIAPWIMRYRDIKAVRLNREHTGAPDEIFRCILDDTNGRKLVIVNTLTATRRYVEIWCQLNNAAYYTFLMALHQRLLPYSLGIRFNIGNPPPDHFGTAAILAGICSAILIPMTLIGADGLTWPITAGVIVAAGGFPFLMKYIRRDALATYSPGRLPERSVPRIDSRSDP